jgi:hypothetical protein
MSDYYTLAGAERLASTIRNHWQARGFDVDVSTFQIPVPGAQFPVFGVRSELRAGLPPGAIVVGGHVRGIT